MTYRAISLCSSAGFMDYAFVSEGFRITDQVEIDPWRRRVLHMRFPRANQHDDVNGDIHLVGKHNLFSNPDVLLGGFPCTPVSGAGQRKGTADERWLWPEFARIIGELRPRVVFLENADEIGAPIKADGVIVAPAPGLEVIASLTALGYDARWGIVSATAAGAPHQRDRWWCVAWRIPDADCDQRQTGSGIDEQRGRTAADHASWDVANSDQNRQPSSAGDSQSIRHQHRNNTPQEQSRHAEPHATEPGDPGVALGDTHAAGLAVGQALRRNSGEEFSPTQRTTMAGHELRHTTSARLEGQVGEELGVAAQSKQGFGRQSVQPAHEPDLGRVVFDGIARRLERLASTQLYAAPLGLQPYPFEPVRLTDDKYDWKARVEAIGDAVCIPVVRAFAAGIREGLWAQDAAEHERRSKTKE